MKKLFAICVLALISSLSYAKTCPSSSEIFVSDHVQLSSNFQVTEAEITSHAEWGRIEDHYYLCTNSNVNGCPFS